jgi:hypothetical protein
VFLPRFLTAFEAIRLLCGSTRLLSRWTLALIHIWAGGGHMPLLSSIIAFPDGEDDVLSHDPRPPPDGAGSPRLRERRASWQVGRSRARMFKLCKESCLRAAGFSSPACKDGGFQTRSLVKVAQVGLLEADSPYCYLSPGSVSFFNSPESISNVFGFSNVLLLY